MTGHIHRIAEPDLRSSELLEMGEGLFLCVNGKVGSRSFTRITQPFNCHQGIIEIVRQREYSPEESVSSLIEEP